MAEDYELPVWGIRPNWSDPVIETLEWLTDVLTSRSGAEQRISNRLAPRRTVEARYNPHENERTFVDLVMHKLARGEWMFPLWFDRSDLTATAVAATSRIDCETQYREFFAGGMAYLVGPDTFSGEAVRISAVDSTGLDLAVPLDKEWPAGTKIHPLRRGRFEAPTQELITSRLAETSLRFEIVEDNNISDSGAWSTTHSDGLPVLDREPEWSENMEIDLSWLGDEFDPGFGIKRVTDTAGRAFRQHGHSFIIVGAKERFEHRQMLYRLNGRQKPIWVPTYADDIEVIVDAASSATALDVSQCGLAYIGGPTDGRDHLYFSDGQIAEITDATLLSGPARERLTLASGLTSAASAGDRASFIEKCRLAQDSIEIEHLGDTHGVARSTLTFRAFADRRVATTATQPIPAAAQSSDPCGTPADPNNCVGAVFEGWYYKAILSLPGNTNSIGAGSLIMNVAGVDGNAANGSTFYQGSDGLYVVGGGERQYHVVSSEQVVLYISNDRGAPTEMQIQMQQLGGGGTPGNPPFVNTASFQTWDGVSSGLVTRQSQVFNPGANSDGGNGLSQFPRAGNFPERFYFGL